MFVSFSLFIYISMMFVISVQNQLLKHVFLDVDKLKKTIDKAKDIKKEKNYDQLEYVRHMQHTKDINFELIYFNIFALIIMFSCMIMLEKYDPLVVFGHRLGVISIMLLIIIEGIIVKKILNKLGLK